MSVIADIVMCGWIPVVLLLFMVLPAQRAVVVSYLVAWLFLPFISYPLSGLPDYTKMSATSVGILLATVVFHFPKLRDFKFRWFDFPMLCFCTTPFFSSITNGLGEYDGISATVNMLVVWGLPYLIGRLFLGDSKSMRELAIGIFVSGLVYLPFCWFEMRMSPQLHGLVYGANYRGGGLRFGGWRPSVFLDSGLQLGMWMATATLIGFWLWKTKAVKKIYNCNFGVLLAILFGTTVLCRSTGALALLLLGIGVLLTTQYLPSKAWLWGLIAIAPLYIATRCTGVWNGEGVIDIAHAVSKDRAGSFQFRLDNEDILIARALQHPIFGWGGWGRNRVHNEWGKDISVTDGLWVIELGVHGIIGMVSMFTFLLLPATVLVAKAKRKSLCCSEHAPAVGLAIVIVLATIDLLPNGMINPIYTLAAGGLVIYAAEFKTRKKQTAEVTEVNSQGVTPATQRQLHSGGIH